MGRAAAYVSLQETVGVRRGQQRCSLSDLLGLSVVYVVLCDSARRTDYSSPHFFFTVDYSEAVIVDLNHAPSRRY